MVITRLPQHACLPHLLCVILPPVNIMAFLEKVKMSPTNCGRILTMTN